MKVSKNTTYGFEYKEGEVNLDFKLDSLERAKDFAKCLEKATTDVNELIRQQETKS